MKFLKQLLFHGGQQGDTLVEVLIALAIISLVIVGAHVASNSSLAATRDAEEHSEASKLLQSQIEYARTLFQKSTADAESLVGTPYIFCVKPADQSVITFNTSGYNNGGKTLLPSRGDTYAAYPGDCKFSAGSYNYNVAVENCKTNASLCTASDTNTLLFHARWDKLGGGQDEVTLAYRDFTPVITVNSANPTSPGGQAQFVTNCGGTNQPLCPTGPANGGTYHYNAQIKNTSTNTAPVLGCSINWGDGSGNIQYAASSPSCTSGQFSEEHIYPAIPGLKASDYPLGCGSKPVTVTLTMRLQGVSPNPVYTYPNPTNPTGLAYPFCY